MKHTVFPSDAVNPFKVPLNNRIPGNAIGSTGIKLQLNSRTSAGITGAFIAGAQQQAKTSQAQGGNKQVMPHLIWWIPQLFRLHPLHRKEADRKSTRLNSSH